MCASKLDDRLDSLATRTAKKNFRDLTAGVFTKRSGKCSGFFDYIALEYRRTLTLQFGYQFSDDEWVVVADVVNTIS
jgi:hypothetical protein